MVAVLSIQSHKVRTSYRRVDLMLFDDSRRWLTALDKGMGFLASKAPMANRLSLAVSVGFICTRACAFRKHLNKDLES